MKETLRKYHDNGTLASETTLVDGIPHGVLREWHRNGILAREEPLNQGAIDGTVRQWDDQGRLLGSCELIKGTGVHRSWYANGRLWSEIAYLDGKLSGRQSVYWEDGELIGVTYWLDNRQVSKKRYREACKTNSRLFRYDDEPTVRKRKPKPTPAQAPASENGDEFALKLLQGPRVREALEWLGECSDPERTLGEATDQEDSLRFVKKLYRNGAVTVYAVEIDGEEGEGQNTGRLVIELPQDKKSRAKLRRIVGNIAEEMGFDPEPECGQRYLFVMLD
jgi:hypothetical protein